MDSWREIKEKFLVFGGKLRGNWVRPWVFFGFGHGFLKNIEDGGDGFF